MRRSIEFKSIFQKIESLHNYLQNFKVHIWNDDEFCLDLLDYILSHWANVLYTEFKSARYNNVSVLMKVYTNGRLSAALDLIICHIMMCSVQCCVCVCVAFWMPFLPTLFLTECCSFCVVFSRAAMRLDVASGLHRYIYIVLRYESECVWERERGSKRLMMATKRAHVLCVATCSGRVAECFYCWMQLRCLMA